MVSSQSAMDRLPSDELIPNHKIREAPRFCVEWCSHRISDCCNFRISEHNQDFVLSKPPIERPHLTVHVILDSMLMNMVSDEYVCLSELRNFHLCVDVFYISHKDYCGNVVIVAWFWHHYNEWLSAQKFYPINESRRTCVCVCVLVCGWQIANTIF